MIQIRNTKQFSYSNSQHAIKRSNLMLLFNVIRDHGAISRIDLAKIVGLSPSTVSNLVDRLIASRWVVETAVCAKQERGRRAVLLEVNVALGCVATVELLSRGYICTLYNVGLERLRGVRIRNTLYDSGNISATIDELLRACAVDTCRLLGIHLIFPGVVDPVNGDLVRSVIIPDAEILDRHLVFQLKKRYPEAHVMISSNGTIIAFEEFIAQDGPPVLPLLSINVDEAIFGGILLSDPENRQHYCFPLEVGHMLVDYRGAPCQCGNRGCLETVCNTYALLCRLNECAGLRLRCSRDFGAECNVASLQQAAQYLAQGAPQVTEVLRDYVRVLSSGLSSVVNMFYIRSIRIGGDLALLGDPFLTLLRQTLHREFHPLDNTYQTQVSLFISDYERARIAATTMCLDRIFCA